MSSSREREQTPHRANERSEPTCVNKRSWLRPSEQEIGNPYYGQKMATCGEIVSS